MVPSSQRAQVLFSRFPSIDYVLTASVTTACLALVTAAYMEGRAPLNGSCSCLEMTNKDGGSRFQERTDKRSSRPFRLKPNQLHELQTSGFLIVDNFLNPAQLQEARDAIEWDRFKANASHADDETTVRTDLVYFQSYDDASSDEKTINNNGMQRTQELLRLVGHAIAMSEFSGFRPPSTVGNDVESLKHDTYHRHRLLVPTEMQVSLYQPGGTYYKAHTDACSDSLYELGLMGYLRSWYLQKRYLTCIVYLNDSGRGWDESDGGCLRIFHREANGTNADGNSPPYTDVKPEPGRMVLFSSKLIQHAVLPTFAPRLACCIWFTLQ